MRLLILWLVAFVFALVPALPMPALGQTIRPADLVGTWIYRRDGGEWADSLKGQLVVTYLKVDGNGTFAYDGKIKTKDGEWRPWGIGWPKGSWGLAADTFRIEDQRNSSAAYKVVLKDGQLVLWDWPMWDAGRHDERCAAKVFERFDPSKPLALPPLPQITIQPADLVGTWVGTFETKFGGVITDTLVLGARGPWALHPGDELTGFRVLGRYKVLLENGELIPCTPVRAVLKRVAP